MPHAMRQTKMVREDRDAVSKKPVSLDEVLGIKPSPAPKPPAATSAKLPVKSPVAVPRPKVEKKSPLPARKKESPKASASGTVAEKAEKTSNLHVAAFRNGFLAKNAEFFDDGSYLPYDESQEEDDSRQGEFDEQQLYELLQNNPELLQQLGYY